MNKNKHHQFHRDFVPLVRDILQTEEFRNMKNYKHHIRGNLYDHSVKTAYLCYRHHRRFRLKSDIGEVVRGALLHDFYLYDLHDKSTRRKFHWFRHPEKALQNALRKYPDLTPSQRDMIRRHMFPLTPIPPRTKAGWLICFYDKVAAVSDRFGRQIPDSISEDKR
ncbi:MAG: HD domain-containing protein [Ruminococcaceae bacterium]|nr:HD domain-containing protein [Oscillospiraceae bacterium]